MIRVDLGKEIDGPGEHAGKRHGKWHWTCEGLSLSGFSRQPLLDACRQIKRMDEALITEQIGLYRQGRDKPDMFCTVGVGAGLTVDEAGPKFVKWKPRDPATWGG